MELGLDVWYIMPDLGSPGGLGLSTEAATGHGSYWGLSPEEEGV